MDNKYNGFSDLALHEISTKFERIFSTETEFSMKNLLIGRNNNIYYSKNHPIHWWNPKKKSILSFVRFHFCVLWFLCNLLFTYACVNKCMSDEVKESNKFS